MSLGENSLVAAYQGKGQLKSRPSGTRVVTFIGGSGGIRDPARKRLIRRIRRIRDTTRNCVNEYIVTGVDTIYSESETYSETVRITRGSGRTFLCAARDLFGVVVRRLRYFGERKETLSFVISEVGADLRKKFVSPDFKWTIGRRLPTVVRNFLTTWFIEDNGQRTNNGIQRRTSQRKGIKL